ncbi:uncharacterized protein LOC135833699 [Planococcus citri]|uniref:uncharacterized protein LOC135833699 n=1 Tax=Planococcus citri TaxID=170843 RepID=UPI0031F8FA2C
MKIGSLSCSSQVITLVALFFNVSSNFIVISVIDWEIVGDLGLGSDVRIGVIYVNLAEFFSSLVAIIFIHDKSNSHVTNVMKYWSFVWIVLLLFLDILFSSHLIVLNSYQQILDIFSLVIGLISYSAFKICIAAVVLSYTSDKTNFIY